MYNNDPLIVDDNGANRFMYFAKYNKAYYYPTSTFDGATSLNTDAQTNDKLGGTATAGQWKAAEITGAKFGLQLGKFVVNVYEGQRLGVKASADKIYYGEFDMFGITSDIIL